MQHLIPELRQFLHDNDKEGAIKFLLRGEEHWSLFTGFRDWFPPEWGASILKVHHRETELKKIAHFLKNENQKQTVQHLHLVDNEWRSFIGLGMREIDSCSFSNSLFGDVNLYQSTVTDCNFSKSQFSSFSFERATFQNCNFQGVSLEHYEPLEPFEPCHFSMRWARFVECDFRGFDFDNLYGMRTTRHCPLTGVTFERCLWRETDLNLSQEMILKNNHQVTFVNSPA